MAEAGVRALRFHIAPRQPGRFSSIGIDAFEKLAPFMAECGMHVQFFMDARELPNVLARLKDWKRPVVLDHFGVLHARQPVDALRVVGLLLVVAGALLVVKPWQSAGA